MARLLSKLNVLVKSNLRNVLPDINRQRKQPDTTPAPTGSDLAQQVVLLRERVNAALDQEQDTVAQLERMQQQIAAWEADVDRALRDGDDAAARYTIRQIQLTQQQHALLTADLEQHRRSTAELIKQVNALEAAAAQANANTPAADDATDSDSSLADRLRRAREKATGTQAAPPTASVRASAPESGNASVPVTEQTVEDDLNQRRQRLSL